MFWYWSNLFNPIGSLKPSIGINNVIEHFLRNSLFCSTLKTEVFLWSNFLRPIDNCQYPYANWNFISLLQQIFPEQRKQWIMATISLMSGHSYSWILNYLRTHTHTQKNPVEIALGILFSQGCCLMKLDSKFKNQLLPDLYSWYDNGFSTHFNPFGNIGSAISVALDLGREPDQSVELFSLHSSLANSALFRTSMPYNCSKLLTPVIICSFNQIVFISRGFHVL